MVICIRLGFKTVKFVQWSLSTEGKLSCSIACSIQIVFFEDTFFHLIAHLVNLFFQINSTMGSCNPGKIPGVLRLPRDVSKENISREEVSK